MKLAEKIWLVDHMIWKNKNSTVDDFLRLVRFKENALNRKPHVQPSMPKEEKPQDGVGYVSLFTSMRKSG